MAGLSSLPGFICNTCPMTEQCPKYEPNHECAYGNDLSAFTSRDSEMFLPFMQWMADQYKVRAVRAIMIDQRMTGQTGNDPTVTRLMDAAWQRSIELQQLMAPQKAQAERSITVIAKESGQAASPQGGGLITQLMATLAPKQLPPKEESNIVTVQPEHVSVLTDD